MVRMAFAVEIFLAVAKGDTLKIKIKNKQNLFQVLTNPEIFDMVLEHGLDNVLVNKVTFDDDTSRFDQLQKDNRGKFVNYFMKIRDKIGLKELRFF
jgi:hypothetical protein